MILFALDITQINLVSALAYYKIRLFYALHKISLVRFTQIFFTRFASYNTFLKIESAILFVLKFTNIPIGFFANLIYESNCL